MPENPSVLVIFGGMSSEHDISCVSAASVLENLDRDKYNAVAVGITKRGEWRMVSCPFSEIKSGEWVRAPYLAATLSLDATKRGLWVFDHDKSARLMKIDVIFPVLHGAFGEDGCIQGAFELGAIPYVGPGVLASAAGMDKAFSKLVFSAAGIRQAKWKVIIPDENLEKNAGQIGEELSYPCFVKPARTGSSIGISKAKTKEELIAAITGAARFDERVLVEEFIDGREIECSVLGNEEPRASVTGEIVPGGEFYDYDAKYGDKGTRLHIPAEIEPEKEEEIRALALLAYKSLGCKGLSRVDFFIHRKTGEVYLNEINTLPGFTSISMYPKLWEASSLPYSRLLDELISLAKTER